MINTLFLQAAQGSSYSLLIMMAMIFAVMYFFMIRPQAKKAKAQDAFVEDIKKGDQVVTKSGIIGKVNKIDGQIVHLQVDQKTYVKMFKSAIDKDLSEAFAKGTVDEVEATTA